jgi:hypothetical protein
MISLQPQLKHVVLKGSLAGCLKMFKCTLRETMRYEAYFSVRCYDPAWRDNASGARFSTAC